MQMLDAMCDNFVKIKPVVALAVSILCMPQVALADEVSDQRKQELAYLLEQDCGSCHGLTLKGGLGSPLTAEALQGKSTEHLFAIIRDGVPGTPMPPWSALLEDDEIRWIVQLLENQGTPQ